MDMLALLQSVLHLLQAVLSALNLYHVYISATNLRQYEEQTERAAQYLDEAAYRLRKTRTTQAAGALAVRLNYICVPHIPSHSPQTSLSKLEIRIPIASTCKIRLTIGSLY
jgi:hypothetical protein